MKTYIKCILANKVTLVGIILLVFGFFLRLPVFNSEELFKLGTVLVSLSMWPLIITFAGFDTYFTYKRTSKIIAEKGIGAVDSINPTSYCNKCGYNLAIKEVKNRNI